MPRATILGLAVLLCAGLVAISPARPQTEPGTNSQRYAIYPDRDGFIGFRAMANHLAAQLARQNQKKVIVMDFHGPDNYWSPFADWLADQFSLALKNVGNTLEVLDRAKLADFEPIEENEFGSGAAKFRVALELGADTFIEGTYRPAENGVGVSLGAYQVIDPGDATSVGTTPVSAVRGKIPFTEEIGSKVYLPLDALWPQNKHLKPGEGGIGHPTCVYCSDYRYSGDANNDERCRVVLLMAVITSEGRVGRVKVNEHFGCKPPDEEAVETLKSWKFNPAMDADNRAVSVEIPLLVTFRKD